MMYFQSQIDGLHRGRELLFADPVACFDISMLSDVPDALHEIDRLSRKYYIAGYFAYEMGHAFVKSASSRKSFGFPLVRVCAFKRPAVAGTTGAQGDSPGSRISNLRFTTDLKTYKKAVAEIKEQIRNGYTYQVNYTGKFKFEFKGSPMGLYQALRKAQPVPYAVYCDFGDETVLSLSPELFFERKGASIWTRPMKGTIKRGKTATEDGRNAAKLRKSEKEIAENLMIVDLMRNDLGRICVAGSVKVPALFSVEKYRTLFQMTSTVKGTLTKGVKYSDIFENIFPGGSVTGAPKASTMRIISGLEKEPRNIYCGAMGFICPGGRAQFNLAIRTIRLRGDKGEMGAGSGVTYDSDPAREYAECLLKGRFLTKMSGRL